MTPEQLTKISKAMDKARGDETPFAVYDPKTDEMAVYGDANKTDNKAMDVLITFRFNKQEFEELGFPKDMATETTYSSTPNSRTYPSLRETTPS